ncbi:spinster family MFS transporter [Paraburkholderia caribensis]|uniref:spinster family MFS transporter n=1 Tax=Paraburkholderia caribensis TaxID=75105 RepID=UPI001CB0BA39|nr:MFS transporter [Paraburkholderia caribensis]CAG9262967.1 MFS transporter [Paraburkholderia caribensis]
MFMTGVVTQRASRFYRVYVLVLMTIIYALNFVDRQIVAILSPYIKADLHLTDAQVGLLYGTSFALFYAVFGLPLARLADGWRRNWTLSIGLTIWSALTAASGLASTFPQLAAARIGIGIGEASASPAAFSMLQDYFSKARRATVLAIYLSGNYIGAGASLIIAANVLSRWQEMSRDFPSLHLVAWQAAYLVVGVPGILLALVAILTIREPERSSERDSLANTTTTPFRDVGRLFAVMLPPFSFIACSRKNAATLEIFRNVLIFVLCVIAAASLIFVTDRMLDPSHRPAVFYLYGLPVTTNVLQWSAMALGAYATASWARSIHFNDPATSRLTMKTGSFVRLVVAGGLVTLISYALTAFMFLYAKRYIGIGPEAGVTLGIISTVAGGLGTMVGGRISDFARKIHPAGRIYFVCGALLLSGCCMFRQYTTNVWILFVCMQAAASFFHTMWFGPVMATCQDLVLPRMRGTATAVQFLAGNLIGLGMGPYWIGLLSDITGNLREAMLSVLVLFPVVFWLFITAAARLPKDETSIQVRSRSAGGEIKH